MRDVRDVLKEYIDNNNLLRASIARKSKMTPDKFSNILNKRRKLEANELFLICGVLGVTPDGLMHYGCKNNKAS
ncbi:MAG: helix-turn-helix transcriptional regulator [Clostridia bacterium]|jgi:transcriptional regulator with XRE-family HTH domain|nr:helix-turn-helix transcriptional regulator [Clostridia bacterium]